MFCVFAHFHTSACTVPSPCPSRLPDGLLVTLQDPDQQLRLSGASQDPEDPVTESSLLCAPSLSTFHSGDQFSCCLLHGTVHSLKARALSRPTDICREGLAVAKANPVFCCACTGVTGKKDFLILLTWCSLDNLNVDFSSGSITSKETMKQDGGTPLRSELGGQASRISAT